MSVLKDLRAWRNDEFDGNVGDMLNEVERILEKAEKNSCEGCKYSGDVSFNGMKVCTECCNNYYNKWTARKTRQSEFLKMFPNAHEGDDGVLNIYPCIVDETLDTDGFPHGTACDRAERYGGCYECKMAYWNEEVE